MKPNLLITSAILTTISLTVTIPPSAQNPPASTYQPGFWQPIARVNPNKPIQVNIANKTGLNIEYDLTTNRDNPPRLIFPKETTVIRGFPLPAYILINVASSEPNSSQINLKYEVTTENNEVNVKISPVGNDTKGNTTLNLHETGAIYVY